MKKAFTIIEIIVSTIIIAVVVIGLLKINKQNADMTEYISLRNKSELSNSLFLTKEAFKYDKSKKDAYTLLSKMPIKNSKTKDYLKKLEKKIYIDKDIPTEKMLVPIKLNALMIKSQFATRYYRFTP